MARLTPSRLAEVELGLERERRGGIRQRRQIKASRAELQAQLAARRHEASIARHARRKEWEKGQSLRAEEAAIARAEREGERGYRRAVLEEQTAERRQERGRAWALQRGQFAAETGMMLEEPEAGKAPKLRAITPEEAGKLGVPVGGLRRYRAETTRTQMEEYAKIRRMQEERLGAKAKMTAAGAARVAQFRQTHDPEARLSMKEIEDITSTVPPEQWGDVAAARLLSNGAREAMLSQIQEDPDLGEYASNRPDDVRRIITQNIGKGPADIYDEIRKGKKQQEIRDDLTAMQTSVDAGQRMEARRRLAVNGVSTPRNYAEALLHKQITESVEPDDREDELQRRAERARDFAYKAEVDKNLSPADREKQAKQYREGAERFEQKLQIRRSARMKIRDYMMENEEWLLDYMMGNKPDVAQRLEMLSTEAELQRRAGRHERADKAIVEAVRTIPGGLDGIRALQELGTIQRTVIEQMLARPEPMPGQEGEQPQAQAPEGQARPPEQPQQQQQPTPQAPAAGPQPAGAAPQPAQPAPAPAEPEPGVVPRTPGRTLSEEDLPVDPKIRATILEKVNELQSRFDAALAAVKARRPGAAQAAVAAKRDLDQYIQRWLPAGSLEEF